MLIAEARLCKDRTGGEIRGGTKNRRQAPNSMSQVFCSSQSQIDAFGAVDIFKFDTSSIVGPSVPLKM